MPKLSHLPNLVLSILRPNIISVCLVGAAALVLAWIGSLTWSDMTVWGKDIGSIFFGSRAGEAISLGIGMTVIHYFSIGMLLLAAGVALFLKNRFFSAEPQEAFVMNFQKPPVNHKNLNKNESNVKETSEVESPVKEENAAAREERFFSGCLHHFGYLSSRPKDSPIPQECIICQRLGDCMVATIYVEKTSE